MTMNQAAGTESGAADSTRVQQTTSWGRAGAIPVLVLPLICDEPMWVTLGRWAIKLFCFYGLYQFISE